MSTERNKELARKVFEEVWNEGRLDRLEAMVAPDYVGHDRSNPEPLRGPGAVRALVNLYREAFPDLNFSIQDQIAEGDRVATRWTARGTHGGEFLGLQPTGKPSTGRGISIHRFAGDRIAESWDIWDALHLLQDLGAVPEHMAAGRAGD